MRDQETPSQQPDLFILMPISELNEVKYLLTEHFDNYGLFLITTLVEEQHRYRGFDR